MQAIIMAGGRGTRLRDITGDTIPKPLVELEGKPLLDHVIENAIKNECSNIIICTGHLGHKIEEHVKNKQYNASIHISQEEQPLGTAGALHLISSQLDNEFFIIYADVYSTINLKKMFEFHKARSADATIAIHISDHPQDSTVVKVDQDGRYLDMIQKPGDDWPKYGNLTQTSLYLVKKEALDFIQENTKQDFETDVFPTMLTAKKRIYGYLTSEYTKDMGTPERYHKVIARLTSENKRQ
ncbi:MAG TPA: nucleotidyltransferase family protein [Patescibacteria group bacterium]|nr:nucleotidyltransferase family protein [Patescibacteria group bacterium]